MNHLKSISYRNSWCQLKRLQSSMSASNSKIEIPPRIERGATDILHALDSTVPRDPLRTHYKFHDDPFLLPSKKPEQRIYSLSFEAGRKTAMWIHREHRNLFPADLSDPPIKEFQRPVVYTDKSQVSEEILLQAISEFNASDAMSIYNLLDGDISNGSKQALLELLCFNNGTTNNIKALPHERWFCKYQDKKIWLHNSEIEKLWKDLISQGPATAAAAYNALICGYARWNKGGEAWLLYEKCQKEDIPLNINTYNYIIELIPYAKKNDLEIKKLLFTTFELIDKKGLCPNVKTLNAALSVIASLSDNDLAENLAMHLIVEFKRMNIKLSLGSYYYIASIVSRKGPSTLQIFINLLEEIEKQKFTVQDSADTKFFVTAMNIAYECYSDIKVATMIHKILLSGDNYQFMFNSSSENSYYNAYLLLTLSEKNMQNFFELYQQVVPSLYIPDIRLMKFILYTLKLNPQNIIVQYLPRLWSDAVMFGLHMTSLSFTVVDMIENITLPAESSSKSLFADVAWDTWCFIKAEMRKEILSPFFSSTTGKIALILLRDGRVKEMREVLEDTIKHSSTFIRNMTKQQVDKLFKECISKNYIMEALLILEYCINAEFQHVVELTKELYNNPYLNDACHEKLVDLVGNEVLQTMNTSSSSSSSSSN
ncbi:small ribosomal subunit protein mS39 [Calliopsis andreniformis]|uniref:small ribosomal subunit protein mS39 n=1 Tax=Calliopsis andreniformis TaxID=337506 RepID=UPI003FCEDA68